MSKVNKNIRPSKIVGTVVLAPSATSTATTTLAQTATSARTQTLQDATDTFVYRATADTLTNKTLTDPSNKILALPRFGNTLIVDAVNGNDTTGAINGLPYATVGAAFTAAISGDTIVITGGTYNISTGLVQPANTYVIGMGGTGTTISMTTSVSAVAYVINQNCRLENLSITITTATASTAISGLSLGVNANTNARVQNVLITASSTASGATSGVVAINCNTSSSSTTWTFGRNITAIATAVNGTALALFGSVSTYVTIRDSTFIATGTSTSYAVQTNAPGCVFTVINSSLSGSAADYMQTAGTITMYDNQLLSTGSALLNNGIVFGGSTTNPITVTQTATAARTQTLQDATDTFVYRATTDTLTNKTLTSTTNLILAYPRYSNTIVVDAVNGNDSTGAVNGLPYASIAAAFAAASAGTCILLAGGAFTITSGVTQPAGTYVTGSVSGTTISMTTTSNAVAYLINPNCRLEDVTISITTATAGLTIFALGIQTNANTSARVENVVLNATSTASGAAADVIGIGTFGTGSATSWTFGRNLTVTATATAGPALAVNVSSAMTVNLRDSTFVATGTATTYAAQVNAIGAALVVTHSALSGTTADYAQISGTLTQFMNHLVSTSSGIVAGVVGISGTAAANYVLQATSATAATWQPMVTAASGYTLLIESYATGTNGANSTGNTWVQRVLNTVVYTQSWLSLASNQFTLAAGTYQIAVSANATNAVNGTQARIKNVTATTYVYGSCAYLNSGLLGTGSTSTVHSNISQFVTIASNTVFQIEQWTGVTTTNAFGLATGATGATEIYLMVEINKLA